MKTLASKTIIYDDTCPLCNLYTGAFVKTGMLEKDGRLSFTNANADMLSKLNLNRARHEIPLVDTKTGQVLYGLDALTLILANSFPVTRGFMTKPWFKSIFRPLYKFVSYNRRVIVGTGDAQSGFNCAPDYSLKWRLVLIAFGMSVTSAAIYGVAKFSGVTNPLMLFVAVASYFGLLMLANLATNKKFEQRIDYVAHLSTLGIIESAVFIAGALLAKFSGMPALLFASQGAGRLFGLWLHNKRVVNNNYSQWLNVAFALGACAMIVYLAFVVKMN